VLNLKMEPSAKFERLYSAKDLKRAILEVETAFHKKIEFMRLFTRFLPYEVNFFVPWLHPLK